MSAVDQPTASGEPLPTDWIDRYRLDVVAIALVCLPIAWAAVRAAAGDWLPIGDDAYFTLRSLDVGTEHHPLLGAWSSGSTATDRSVNNLGPLQLDYLAPFTRWTPFGGTAVAVGLWNIAAVATIGWLVGRLGGRLLTVVAMAPVGLMCWTMGSEMLITPRQHQFLLLTYLCLLVASWAATAGDRWAPIVVIVTGSMVVQTHLSYPLLVAPLVLVTVAGQVLACRRDGAIADRVLPWSITGALVVLLWIQTAVDQVAGRGNLGDVLLTSSSTQSPGWWHATRIVGAAVLHPRWLVRRGYADYTTDLALGDAGRWLGALVIVAVVGSGVLSVVAWRSARHTMASGSAVATIALVAGIVNAARLPYTEFGLPAGNYRWLFPTAVFLLIGTLAAGANWVATADRADLRRGAASVALGLTAVLGVASVPRSSQDPDPSRYLAEQAVTAEMVAQLRELPNTGPVIIDQSNLSFGHPFAYPAALALAIEGVDYRFDDPAQQYRFGADRLADGSESLRLVLWDGDAALERRAAPDTVVFVGAPHPLAITREEP